MITTKDLLCLNHGLQTAIESFFLIPNILADWADGPNKFWSILGTFGCHPSKPFLSLWVPNGPIKPKADWHALDSPKKMNKHCFFAFYSKQNKMFVSFLGESTARTNSFWFCPTFNPWFFLINHFYKAVLKAISKESLFGFGVWFWALLKN